MKNIEAKHYTETLIYALDKTLRNVKTDINQYISSILSDITPEQFFVLDTIYSNPNCCQQDISDILTKDKSNVKRIVEILESKNLIIRTFGKKNNRLVYLLEITDQGKTLIEENMTLVKEHMMSMFKDITDDEIKLLKNIIKKLQK